MSTRPAYDSFRTTRRRPHPRLKGWRRTLWALSSILVLTGCASPGPIPSAAPESGSPSDYVTPLFFRVEGADGGELLLLGTIHLGPPEGWRYSPAIRDGIARADRFLLEIDPRLATEEAVSSLVAEKVVLERPNTLPDVVSPETAKLLDEKDALLTELGMPRKARKWMKPWFVTIGLAEAISRGSGYALHASVESHLLDAIGTRPLAGLETFEQQMGFFDDLSPTLQDAMLRDTLLRLEEAAESVETLAIAWREGDGEALLEIAGEGLDEVPELEPFYDLILGVRNRRWLDAFRPILDEREQAGETVFVAVGALHLVGPDGLVSLLREAGYGVEPIDHSDAGGVSRP